MTRPPILLHSAAWKWLRRANFYSAWPGKEQKSDLKSQAALHSHLARWGPGQVSMGLQVKVVKTILKPYLAKYWNHRFRYWKGKVNVSWKVFRYNCLFITCTYTVPLVIMGACYSRMARWILFTGHMAIMCRKWAMRLCFQGWYGE